MVKYQGKIKKNACLKYPDRDDSKNLVDYMLNFAEGPCLPAILVHGAMSSKLIVEIDCPVLQKEHPDIFETCGWTDCD